MPADNVLSVIRRYSGYIDTSGAEPPRGIQVVPMLGGGVYTQTDQGPTNDDDIFHGRLSLGVVAAFILGAVAFYVYTRDIQGGG
jgi:hypothetical protein